MSNIIQRSRCRVLYEGGSYPTHRNMAILLGYPDALLDEDFDYHKLKDKIVEVLFVGAELLDGQTICVVETAFEDEAPFKFMISRDCLQRVFYEGEECVINNTINTVYKLKLFAKKIGHPEASGINIAKGTRLAGRIVKILAMGSHDKNFCQKDTLAIVETIDNKEYLKFTISVNGLEYI